MSESDDTDILLLIPPDLFTVASSASEESLTNACHYSTDNQTVSCLFEQVQMLENRMSAIEINESPLKLTSLSRRDDLSTPLDTFESSKSYKSPATRLKKSPTKPLNYSASRYLSSSNATDAGEKRHTDLFTKFYTSATNSDNYTANDQLSPLNFKTKNSQLNTHLPGLVELKCDKDMNFGRQNIDTINDYSLLLNNSSSGNSIIVDRLSERKSPINEQLSRKIRDIKKLPDHYNYYDNKDYNKTLSPKKIDIGVNTDFIEFRSQKLLSLTDFWNPDPSKSEIEKLRIKIEEEKFRREHCERTIQELQSRLLEQQEKVAVAIGIDNEKNSIITQYQLVTKKLKNQIQLLQNNYRKLDENLAEIKANNQVEIDNLKIQLKNYEDELMNSRDLSKDLKIKIDTNVEEKVKLLETHANELDNYKSLIEKSDKNYEKLKIDYDKVIDKNKELEESLLNVQQDLYRERLKAGEIRSEMGLIHKALDTCEAELTVLRQEKENLLIKLKEEENRCEILEQKRMKIIDELNCIKESDDRSKDEIKKVIEQQDKMRCELREIYQNQVHEVVNVKLKEFQGQLDAAEAAFNTELDAKQRAIAECAASKIKSIIDKHQLEINLIEEKHKEEKRLYELRLSQIIKKTHLLEGKLKAQENAKCRIAEQLHTLMEKQWKQAVQIISSDNDGNFDNTDYSRELRCLINNNRGSDEVGSMEPVRLRSEPIKNFYHSHQEHDESVVTFASNDEGGTTVKESRDDLKKYIKMILQMQESKKFSGTHGENESSVSSSECRQVPRKYYTKADATSASEKTVTWEETVPSTVFNAVSMTQVDSKPSKPPWK